VTSHHRMHTRFDHPSIHLSKGCVPLLAGERVDRLAIVLVAFVDAVAWEMLHATVTAALHEAPHISLAHRQNLVRVSWLGTG